MVIYHTEQWHGSIDQFVYHMVFFGTVVYNFGIFVDYHGAILYITLIIHNYLWGFSPFECISSTVLYEISHL